MSNNSVKKAKNLVDGFYMKGRCADCGEIGEINKIDGSCRDCAIKTGDEKDG